MSNSKYNLVNELLIVNEIAPQTQMIANQRAGAMVKLQSKRAWGWPSKQKQRAMQRKKYQLAPNASGGAI